MIDLLNNKELGDWMRQLRAHGYESFVAIKGEAPKGMTYEDGEAITRPINIAWRCVDTGEVFALEYGEAAH